ncbi:hypothetical protein IFM12275_15110 [Nocardia sputorum]|uniref:hypothetical protein n=1 Tax=Nocardia TaxID=1817 RepID=UPI0024937B2D|nr:hypothetical protein [Nocardia sputorum]BDT91535.1 hypothetical protein IFM12275_15110 [Nocardia sputorum]
MTMITPSSGDWVPDSCTLPTAEQPVRVAEFDRFFAESVRRTDRPARTRLELLLNADAAAAGRELAAHESGCCSLFAFTFEAADTGPVMRIEVPGSQVEVLDALAARVDAAIGGDRR